MLTGLSLNTYGESSTCAQKASDLITLAFDYGDDDDNNGNIVGQAIDASSEDVWQQYYTYDGTNRLAMASENAAISGSTCPAGATWCRKYGYDHFGNRWISASLDTLHMATPTAQSAVSLATNRLTSGTYDAAGNLTAQTYITTGGGSMAYDANNKVTSFTATGVSVATKYDSADRRVRKVYNAKTTIWVYDAFGKLAAEYSTETQPTPVGTYYRTTDHLGSTRLVTDESGRARQRHDFFPFGEQIPASASFGDRNDVIDGGLATYNASLSVRQQFTGQQRDEETGLDYFWARNMAAPLGRFLSMDPGNAGARISKPQTWNGFVYVSNTPLGRIDPDGRCDQTWQSIDYGGGGNSVGGVQRGDDCPPNEVWVTANPSGIGTISGTGAQESPDPYDDLSLACTAGFRDYWVCPETAPPPTLIPKPKPKTDVPLDDGEAEALGSIPGLVGSILDERQYGAGFNVWNWGWGMSGPPLTVETTYTVFQWGAIGLSFTNGISANGVAIAYPTFTVPIFQAGWWPLGVGATFSLVPIGPDGGADLWLGAGIFAGGGAAGIPAGGSINVTPGPLINDLPFPDSLVIHPDEQ